MHKCARCGRRRHREDLVHSRTSRNYYCGPKYFDACDKRVKKNTPKGGGAALPQLHAEAERYYSDAAYRESLPWSEQVA